VAAGGHDAEAIVTEATDAIARLVRAWTSPRAVDTGVMRPWSMVAG
jgi:hypothetical protein